MELMDFDSSFLAASLIYPGSVSFPILPKAVRASLLIEALSYPYCRRETVVGPAKVRQEVQGFDDFPPTSQFYALRDASERLLKAKLSSQLFSRPLYFDDLSLQKYLPGSLGITPHRDGRNRINLVCVFILKGQGKFYLCEDRSGKNAVELDSIPGNVILMRAPGFNGANFRPLHFVSDIKNLRITFGLRQKAVLV